MKALVYHGPGRKAWEDVPDAQVTDDTDAVVRVETVTICGTDLHILKGDTPEVADGRILGHEAVGTVVAVGGGVKTVEPGDRVLVSCISACGHCRFCREGRFGQCLGGGGWILGYMPDLGRGQVAPGQAGHLLPGNLAFLATARQREPPVPGDVVPECLHCLRVAGGGVVRFIPPDHAGQPFPLLGDGHVAAALQLGLHRLQLGRQLLLARDPLDPEPPLPGHPGDMPEPQKGERLRRPLTSVVGDGNPDPTDNGAI